MTEERIGRLGKRVGHKTLAWLLPCNFTIKNCLNLKTPPA
ncbi:hypothetical protein [Caudoviricetes sp.]|nr:hypothetical protein [Caudoviricetes sp.]